MKIGELAARAGLAPSAIRYYEQSGLMPEPARGANGYRDYPDSAVERLRLIRGAQQLGFTLDSLRDAFAHHDTLPPQTLLCGLDRRLEEIRGMMATLRAQRDELRRLRGMLVDAQRRDGEVAMRGEPRRLGGSPDKADAKGGKVAKAGKAAKVLGAPVARTRQGAGAVR